MAIRNNDEDSKILIITEEEEFYSRNSLSKEEVWDYSEEKFNRVFFPPSLYSNETVWKSTKVQRMDIMDKIIEVNEKRVNFYHYFLNFNLFLILIVFNYFLIFFFYFFIYTNFFIFYFFY